MSNKAFLARFQNKITTVSAQGKIVLPGSQITSPTISHNDGSSTHMSQHSQPATQFTASHQQGVSPSYRSDKYEVPEYESSFLFQPAAEAVPASGMSPQFSVRPKDVKKKPTLKDLQEISNVAITTLPTNGSSRNPSYCETDSWERFRENDNNDAMAAPDSDDRYDNSDPHDFFMDRTMAEEREKPSKKEKKVSRKDPGMIEKKSKKSSDAAHKPKEEQRAFGQERNEAKVKSAEDQLAFSKKPRGVKYDPKTIDDYKKMTTEKYYELGKLQPDLNSEELLMKKANIERVREFSRNLRTINVKQTESAKKKPVIDVKELGKEKSTREKALEFAKKVPKPKTVAKAQSPKEPTPEQPPAQNTNTSARTYTRKGEREPQLSSLEELETLHFQSRQQAAEIRRSLTKSY